MRKFDFIQESNGLTLRITTGETIEELWWVNATGKINSTGNIINVGIADGRSAEIFSIIHGEDEVWSKLKDDSESNQFEGDRAATLSHLKTIINFQEANEGGTPVSGSSTVPVYNNDYL